MFAGKQLETGGLHAGTECLRMREQRRAQLRRALDQLERAQRHGCHDGRDAVREEIRSRALPQPSDSVGLAARVTAATAAERLAKRAGEEVDALAYSAMLRRSAAVRAHEPRGVRVVDHYERAVLVGQITDLL